MARASVAAEPIRVLLVDDDQALLRMLQMSMASEGFRVATAPDGLNGIEQLCASDFDVIVLDLEMPRMDGRAFCREMASLGRSSPVVVLSAYGARQAQRELKLAAAVPKPFDPDDLIETVRRVAARRQTAKS